jgi:hypothetical protein
MTREEAFKLVDGVLVQLKFSRTEHMQVMEAMKVLVDCAGCAEVSETVSKPQQLKKVNQ